MLGAPAFERLENDAYFTIDAKMAVDALLNAISVKGPVLEPAAGRGHLVQELRGRGYEVEASDLVAHPDPLVGDIETGRCITSIAGLEPYENLITNLPYDEQDALLAHLLPLAEKAQCMVATLTRSAWHHAKARRKLVHTNPFFRGIVYLPRRPWWSEQKTFSPRHDFTWVVWGPTRRRGERPSIFYPET